MIAVAKEKWSSFGAKLREFREFAGLTQKDLGDAVEMKPQAIARLEAGETNPSWATAVKIAEALERSLDEFLDPG